MTYCANKGQRRVVTPEDMEIQVGNTVIPDRDGGKKRDCPAIACAEDDMVDVIHGGAVGEVDGSLTVRRGHV